FDLGTLSIPMFNNKIKKAMEKTKNNLRNNKDFNAYMINPIHKSVHNNLTYTKLFALELFDLEELLEEQYVNIRKHMKSKTQFYTMEYQLFFKQLLSLKVDMNKHLSAFDYIILELIIESFGFDE